MADESIEEQLRRPFVGVGVIIVRDGKILIGERLKGSKFGANTFLVPGGHLEFGESCKSCVEKEVEEETGLTGLTDITLVSVNNHVVYDRHYLNLNFSAVSKEGEPTTPEPHKVANWKWYDPKNVPRPLFLPTERAIEDWLLGRSYADFQI